MLASHPGKVGHISHVSRLHSVPKCVGTVDGGLVQRFASFVSMSELAWEMGVTERFPTVSYQKLVIEMDEWQREIIPRPLWLPPFVSLRAVLRHLCDVSYGVNYFTFGTIVVESAYSKRRRWPEE